MCFNTVEHDYILSNFSKNLQTSQICYGVESSSVTNQYEKWVCYMDYMHAKPNVKQYEEFNDQGIYFFK